MAKVFLAAGHGGKDPGACAYGLQEKVLNLTVMLACKEELERHGVQVVCNRTTDVEVGLADKCNMANRYGADIAVSFHANAGGGDGFEVFYYSTSTSGKRLAGLCEKYVKELGQNSRGLKSGNHLYFVKNTNMPAVLVESAFLDNDKDNNIIDTKSEQKKFGVAYAKAILEYLGIAYKEKVVAKPVTTVKSDFKVGEVVKLLSGAKYTNGGAVPTWVINSKLYVREIRSNGDVVISTQKTGAVTGVVASKYIVKENASFLVRVTADVLNIRAGAGTNYKINGQITNKGTYTITETNGEWGKLKSNAGWIYLPYTEKI